MIRSMTGFGEAERDTPAGLLRVDLAPRGLFLPSGSVFVGIRTAPGASAFLGLDTNGGEPHAASWSLDGGRNFQLLRDPPGLGNNFVIRLVTETPVLPRPSLSHQW